MDVVDPPMSSSLTNAQPSVLLSQPASAISDTTMTDSSPFHTQPDAREEKQKESGTQLQPQPPSEPVVHNNAEPQASLAIPHPAQSHSGSVIMAADLPPAAAIPPSPVPAQVPAQILAPPAPTDMLEPEVPESKPECDNGGSDNSLAAVVPQTPQTMLTFLLASGRRRTMSFDPETTIARVKELVWNAWPSEWQDEHPPTPSYLRVLYLGKILQDDDTLTTVAFPIHTPLHASAHTPPSPTIVHLAIRPYAPQTDNDAYKKKGRRRGARGDGDDGAGADGEGVNGRGSGCCSGCIIC